MLDVLILALPASARDSASNLLEIEDTEARDVHQIIKWTRIVTKRYWIAATYRIQPPYHQMSR